jgi:hypothetical protein
VLPSLHFDGRVIISAEIERIHKEVLKFEHIEAIPIPMRELIEDYHLSTNQVREHRACAAIRDMRHAACPSPS